MLRKTIKYVDFNGDEQEDVLYFNFSKAELIELETSAEGGLSDTLKTIVDTKNITQIFQQFKKIVLLAYGERSDDGKRFIKNDKIREKFLSTEAYSELVMEFLSNEDSAAEFVNGIMPAGLIEEVAKIIAEKNKENGDDEEQKQDEAPELQSNEN